MLIFKSQSDILSWALLTVLPRMAIPSSNVEFLQSVFKSETLRPRPLPSCEQNGRDDVYAKRWENQSKGISGYSPVCLNQWQKGMCGKPKIPCSKCKHKSYDALDEDVIERIIWEGTSWKRLCIFHFITIKMEQSHNTEVILIKSLNLKIFYYALSKKITITVTN